MTLGTTILCAEILATDASCQQVVVGVPDKLGLIWPRAKLDKISPIFLETCEWSQVLEVHRLGELWPRHWRELQATKPKLFLGRTWDVAASIESRALS